MGAIAPWARSRLLRNRPVICYHDEKFSGAVLNHPTYEKELTALVQCVGKWKDDLVSEERIVHNSHRPTAAFQTTEITKGSLDGIYADVPSYW